jgi:hypothetical protein
MCSSNGKTLVSSPTWGKKEMGEILPNNMQNKFIHDKI